MISPALEVAVGFASRNISVFPCSKKRPLTPNGFKDASLAADTLLAWWSKRPEAQVGIATGHANHLLVVDIDGPRAEPWLAEMHLPETFEVESSPGHRQMWFHQPDDVVTKCSARLLAPDVDIRGDGGYVIAPGSIHHATGKPYRILKDLPWADAPANLLALCRADASASQTPGPASDAIPQGRRHQTMLAIAGGLRARRMEPASILATLRAVNEQRCRPPLPLAELERMASYVGGRPAGFRGERIETPVGVELECFADVPVEKLEWLWPSRVPLGKLSLFVGNPEAGKSMATVDLAARVSRGAAFPDGQPCETGDVVFLTSEDDPRDTIKPRLLAAGADMSRVHRVKAVKVTLADGSTASSHFSLDRDLERLEDALEKLRRPRLIIVDPLTAYLGKGVDSHRDAEVRAILDPLAEMAGRRRLSTIGICHMRKSEITALLRVGGSIAFTAVARAVWGFAPDPDDPHTSLMVCLKMSIARRGEAIAYQIEPVDGSARISWIPGLREADVDEIFTTDPRRKRARATARQEAEDWLREQLAGGPRPQEEIAAAAQRDGLSWATVRRAKSRLRVTSRKDGMGGGWAWEIPEDAH